MAICKWCGKDFPLDRYREHMGCAQRQADQSRVAQTSWRNQQPEVSNERPIPSDLIARVEWLEKGVKMLVAASQNAGPKDPPRIAATIPRPGEVWSRPDKKARWRVLSVTNDRVHFQPLTGEYVGKHHDMPRVAWDDLVYAHSARPEPKSPLDSDSFLPDYWRPELLDTPSNCGADTSASGMEHGRVWPTRHRVGTIHGITLSAAAADQFVRQRQAVRQREDERRAQIGSMTLSEADAYRRGYTEGARDAVERATHNPDAASEPAP